MERQSAKAEREASYFNAGRMSQGKLKYGLSDLELVFVLHTIANILIGFSRKKEVLHLLETVASVFGVAYFFMSNRPITVLLFIFALINIVSKFRTSFRGFFKVFWPLLVFGFYYLCYKLYEESYDSLIYIAGFFDFFGKYLDSGKVFRICFIINKLIIGIFFILSFNEKEAYLSLTVFLIALINIIDEYKSGSFSRESLIDNEENI